VRISVFCGVSLDGYLAREDHALDFLDPFHEDHGYVDFMRTIDCLVIGRLTYDVVCGFGEWPYPGKRVVVLTHRELAPRRGEEAHAGPLAPLAARLANEGVQRVYLDGGIAIQQGLDEDLVDDMTISTVPVAIGRGRRLFPGGAAKTQAWKLEARRDYPSGIAQSVYVRPTR
jgi:dihydrofolate reductase